MRLRCFVVSFAMPETTRPSPVESNQPSSAQLFETAILHPTLVRPETRGDQKTQDKRAGDQPEQLHQIDILVSSFGLLYYFCSASVLSLKNFLKNSA